MRKSEDFPVLAESGKAISIANSPWDIRPCYDLLSYLHAMSSIVINPKNDEELQFVAELLKKLGVATKVLSDEEQEDLGLGLLMKDVDRSDLASEEEILGKLAS